jgi:hypothetical protein
MNLAVSLGRGSGCCRSDRTSCVGRRTAHRSHDRRAMSASLKAEPPETISISSVRTGLHSCGCGNLARNLQVICVISVNETCSS